MLSSSSHQSSNEWIMNCYWSVHDTNEIIYGLYKYDVCRIFFKNDEVYLQRKSVLRSQSMKNNFFWLLRTSSFVWFSKIKLKTILMAHNIMTFKELESSLYFFQLFTMA